MGRRGEPERFGSKAGEADIAVRAQFNAAGKNAVRRDARRAKVDLAGPRSATRRFDHDAAARGLSGNAEAAVPAAALTRDAAAGFARKTDGGDNNRLNRQRGGKGKRGAVSVACG